MKPRRLPRIGGNNSQNINNLQNNSQIQNPKTRNIMNKKNWKQNKFNINKKLNIINENKENQNIYKISENKRMNNHKNLIYGNSTSYIIEESKKTGKINLEKNENYKKEKKE